MKYKVIIFILLMLSPFFLEASEKYYQNKYIKRIEKKQKIMSNNLRNMGVGYSSDIVYTYDHIQYYYLMGKYQGLGLAKYEIKKKKYRKK